MHLDSLNFRKYGNHFYITVYRLTLYTDIIGYLENQVAEGFPSLK